MGDIAEANTVEEFQQIAAAHEKVLVFFWAHWSQPCKALDEMLPDVLSMYPGVKCVKVRLFAFPLTSAPL
jgi:thioredoxin-like negative regulator of GroEL